MTPDDLTTRLNPAALVTDSLGYDDHVLSVFAGDVGSTPLVVFTTTESNEEGEPSEWIFVSVSVADARRFAAGILNAADEAEGKAPLLFMPECSSPCCLPKKAAS